MKFTYKENGKTLFTKNGAIVAWTILILICMLMFKHSIPKYNVKEVREDHNLNTIDLIVEINETNIDFDNVVDVTKDLGQNFKHNNKSLRDLDFTIHVYNSEEKIATVSSFVNEKWGKMADVLFPVNNSYERTTIKI